MSLLESLKWRYATKQFDSTKKVSEEDLNKIKEAIQLSASSYGLQLYKAIIIKDQATKDKLVPASWGQKQVSDASAVIVLASYSSVKPEDVDSYVERMADVRGMNKSDLSGFGDFVKGKMAETPVEAQQIWTNKQTYIALGNILAICGELQIDSCPMEGFEPDKYNEILGLTEKGLNAAVVIPVGYRSEEDKYAGAAKVRRSESDLFIEV